MAKDKQQPPPEALDQSLDAGERADALMLADAGLDRVEEVKPRGVATVVSRERVSEVAKTESLIPDIKDIFGADAEFLEVELGKATGVKLDLEPPKQKIRVKKNQLPDDIYDASLRPEVLAQIEKLVIYFLQPVLGNHELIRLFKLATGRNQSVVTMLRESVWFLLWNRKDRLDGAPEDRTRADEDENSLENQRLVQLLEWQTFDQLNAKATGYGCSNVTALAYMVKNALEGEALSQA